MVLAAASLMGAAMAQDEKVTLKVGDKAPPLAVAKWLKGNPIETFKPGQVYVVEFWATWCGPCKVSIPHLTELQKKYGDKVSFNGISVWEEQKPTDEKYIEKVQTFVTEWGDKMAYNVAVDGMAGTMAKTWMEAAGQGGIPSAFVVNGEGVVVWIGHPMSDLDKVLDEVVAGKFDVKAAQAKADKAAQEATEMERIVQPLQAALSVGDPNAVIVEIDKILAQKPDMEPSLGRLKFTMLFEAQRDKELYAYAEKSFKGFAKDDAEVLNEMAWTIIENADKKLAKPNYGLAVKIAEKAVKLEPEDSAILDTLAFGYFKMGNVKKAIEIQTKAVANLDKAEYPDEMKTEIRGRLAEFKKKG